jgi:hypothetical protein
VLFGEIIAGYSEIMQNTQPKYISGEKSNSTNLIFMDPCIVDYPAEIPTRCSFVIEFIIPKFIEC